MLKHRFSLRVRFTAFGLKALIVLSFQPGAGGGVGAPPSTLER
jgi:hypothetical protein